jgi:hypothetical protein
LDAGNVAASVPFRLWDQPRWELLAVTDAQRFFENVGSVALGGTTLFLEGTSQSLAVRQSLEQLREPGPYLPAMQTMWPRPEQWRLPFTSAVLEELARFAAANAEPELADHLFIYAGDAPLVAWPDAFAADAPIHIAATVAEELARELARRFGGSARWIDGAVQQRDEADER